MLGGTKHVKKSGSCMVHVERYETCWEESSFCTNNMAMERTDTRAKVLQFRVIECLIPTSS